MENDKNNLLKCIRSCNKTKPFIQKKKFIKNNTKKKFSNNNVCKSELKTSNKLQSMVAKNIMNKSIEIPNKQINSAIKNKNNSKVWQEKLSNKKEKRKEKKVNTSRFEIKDYIKISTFTKSTNWIKTQSTNTLSSNPKLNEYGMNT